MQKMKFKKNGQDYTIVDIARELNISAATVSRALNNHNDISDATKERVRNMARKMGYQRNRIASGLRSKKSYTVGFIIPSLSSFFQTELLTDIQNQMHEYGYNVIICQSNESFELEQELVNTLYSYRVDALFASLTLFTSNYNHFQAFIDRGIPVVFYDRVPKEKMHAHVIKGDDFRGGFLAGNHLIETGCKSFAFINGPVTCNLYHDRYKGFKAALEGGGFVLEEDMVYCHELTYENAWDTCRKIFDEKKIRPDGIFATNDISAIAILQYAKERGIKVPSELKIIGYSNDPRTSFVTPSITTIDQKIPEIADSVVKAFLDLINGNKDIAPAQVKNIKTTNVIGVELIRRMST